MATKTHLWYDESADEYFASHSGFAREDGGNWRNVAMELAHARRAVFFGEWIGGMPTPRELRLKGTEHGEQAALFCWAAACANAYESCEPLRWMFAVPNGGARDRVTASMMKGEGVKPGVPDVMLPVTKPEYAGLWLEMKRVTGGILSPEQKAYGEWLTSQRYRWVRADGYAIARREVIEYMNLSAPARPMQ